MLPESCYLQDLVPYMTILQTRVEFHHFPPEVMHFGALPCLHLLPHLLQKLSLATHLEAPHPDKAGTCKRPAESLSNRILITEHAGSNDAGQHCTQEVAALAPDRPGKQSGDGASLAMQTAIPCRRSSAKRALSIALSKRPFSCSCDFTAMWRRFFVQQKP